MRPRSPACRCPGGSSPSSIAWNAACGSTSICTTATRCPDAPPRFLRVVRWPARRRSPGSRARTTPYSSSGSIASRTGRCRTFCSTGTATTASTTSTSAAAFPRPICGAARRTTRRASTSADGVFDPEFVSRQLGAAVILKALVDLGAVTVDQQVAPAANPAATAAANTPAPPAANPAVAPAAAPPAPPPPVAPVAVEASAAAIPHIARELAYPGLLKQGAVQRREVRRQARTGVAAHPRLRGAPRFGLWLSRPPISSRRSRPARGGHRRASSTNRRGTC